MSHAGRLAAYHNGAFYFNDDNIPEKFTPNLSNNTGTWSRIPTTGKPSVMTGGGECAVTLNGTIYYIGGEMSQK